MLIRFYRYLLDQLTRCYFYLIPHHCFGGSYVSVYSDCKPPLTRLFSHNLAQSHNHLSAHEFRAVSVIFLQLPVRSGFRFLHCLPTYCGKARYTRYKYNHLYPQLIYLLHFSLFRRKNSEDRYHLLSC